MPPRRRNASKVPASSRSTRSHTLAPNSNAGPSGSNGAANNTPNATDSAAGAANSSNKRWRDKDHDSCLQDLEIRIVEKKLALLEQQL
jgi:hypothetical protein